MLKSIRLHEGNFRVRFLETQPGGSAWSVATHMGSVGKRSPHPQPSVARFARESRL